MKINIRSRGDHQKCIWCKDTIDNGLMAHESCEKEFNSPVKAANPLNLENAYNLEEAAKSRQRDTIFSGPTWCRAGRHYVYDPYKRNVCTIHSDEPQYAVNGAFQTRDKQKMLAETQTRKKYGARILAAFFAIILAYVVTILLCIL